MLEHHSPAQLRPAQHTMQLSAVLENSSWQSVSNTWPPLPPVVETRNTQPPCAGFVPHREEIPSMLPPLSSIRSAEPLPRLTPPPLPRSHAPPPTWAQRHYSQPSHLTQLPQYQTHLSQDATISSVSHAFQPKGPSFSAPSAALRPPPLPETSLHMHSSVRLPSHDISFSYPHEAQHQRSPGESRFEHTAPQSISGSGAAVSSPATVSPLSGSRPYETPLCVSPLSVSNAPPTLDSYNLPSSSKAMALSEPQGGGSHIDDSLITRLRGIKYRRTLPAESTVTGLDREPQIKDTSESLATGYVESSDKDTVLLNSPLGIRGVMPDKPHACRKCSATFRRRDNLIAHIRAQHKGERPFECERCGYRFIKKDHAMKHWKVVHLKERPFKCNTCDSRFGQRSDLNKHVRSVHLGIKPFECEHCGLRFSHRGNQIRHQAVVHEKRKPFSCKDCDSSFAEKSNLLKHQQAVHKRDYITPFSRPAL